jgi:hypothetical protein
MMAEFNWLNGLLGGMLIGLTALILGIWNPVLFVIALLAGSLTYRCKFL